MKRMCLLLSVLLFSVTGCTVYREFPIEIYKPGEIPIEPGNRNVALVYRNFNYPGDTLQNYYKSDYQLKKAFNSPNLSDSALVGTCLQELSENLKNNHAFNRVEILPITIFKKHEGEKLPPLNISIIKNITEATETDLLISLETYSSFYTEYSGNYDVAQSNEVITAAVWAVYDPKNEKLVERKAMIDTIYWNRFDEQGNIRKDLRLPPRETALTIAAQLAGENYAKRFYASWQTVSRMYSVPPLPDFSVAAGYIQDGQWDNAIALWERYAAGKNGKLAISARYNLALGYEMKDDFETASNWAAAAQQLALKYRSREDLKMIMLYQKILEQRKKEIQQIQQHSDEKPD